MFVKLTSIRYSSEINSKNVEWYDANELYSLNRFRARPLPPVCCCCCAPAPTPAARSSIFLFFHWFLVLGDEFNICVADDDEDEDRGGGVNVTSGLSIWPRCIRAVRLSDAFCFLIVRLLLLDILCDMLHVVCVGLVIIRVPWKLEGDDRAAMCNGIAAADNKLENDDRDAICNGSIAADSINKKMLHVHLLGIKFEMHLLE